MQAVLTSHKQYVKIIEKRHMSVEEFIQRDVDSDVDTYCVLLAYIIIGFKIKCQILQNVCFRDNQQQCLISTVSF